MIRPFEPRDGDGVLSVWRAAARIAHPFLSDAFLEQEERAIRYYHLPESDTWVWAADRAVFGFISLIGNEIGGLFVHPAEQRRGIGRALLEQALELHPTLEVEVFERNQIGRAFYAKRGFKQTGVEFDERASERVLHLQLDPKKPHGEKDGQ